MTDIGKAEHDVNDVIMLKHYAQSVRPIYEALTDARSSLLTMIRDACYFMILYELEYANTFPALCSAHCEPSREFDQYSHQ